jgi:hypothetical protein
MMQRNSSFASIKTAMSGDHRLSAVLDQADTSFGCTVDLNTRSRPVRDLVNIVRHEKEAEADSEDVRRGKSGSYSVQVAHTATELCSAAMQRQSAVDQSSGESAEDADTLSAIVEYSRRHDALMSFYYMDDESGQMKVTEIFGVDANKSDSPPSLLVSSSRTPRRQSIISEESLPGRRPSSLEVPQYINIDASSHITEKETYNMRDACTSPMRNPPSHTSTIEECVVGNRAMGMSLRRNRHGRPTSVIVAGNVLDLTEGQPGADQSQTDDGDDDDDRLFMPSRRNSRRIGNRDDNM